MDNETQPELDTLQSAVELQLPDSLLPFMADFEVACDEQLKPSYGWWKYLNNTQQHKTAKNWPLLRYFRQE